MNSNAIFRFRPGFDIGYYSGEKRDKYNSDNHRAEMIAYQRDIAEEVTCCRDDSYPRYDPEHIENQKSLICHLSNTGHEGRKLSDQRYKPRQHDCFSSMPVIKLVCFIDILPVDETAVSLRVYLFPDRISDIIVQTVSEERENHTEKDNS